MAKERQGFLLFHDLRGVLEKLSDEQRGHLLMAMLDYSEGGVIPAFGDPALEIAFAVAKEKIDRYVETWTGLKSAQSSGGKRSGETRRERAKLYKLSGGEIAEDT